MKCHSQRESKRAAGPWGVSHSYLLTQRVKNVAHSVFVIDFDAVAVVAFVMYDFI